MWRSDYYIYIYIYIYIKLFKRKNLKFNNHFWVVFTYNVNFLSLFWWSLALLNFPFAQYFFLHFGTHFVQKAFASSIQFDKMNPSHQQLCIEKQKQHMLIKIWTRTVFCVMARAKQGKRSKIISEGKIGVFLVS